MRTRYLIAIYASIGLAVGGPLGGCEKSKDKASEPQSHTDPAAADRSAPAATPAGAARPAGQASPPAAGGDEVRPPRADDLAEYTQDLPGSGPLMATIDTTMGVFHCELFAKQAPMTVANFVGLARGLKPWRDPRSGEIKKEPFFDGLIFHRVIPHFMVQGGDPLGQGIGGPGYKFDDEIDPSLRHDKGGILSMANSGPGTNGSQFFITEVPTPHLDGRHTIYGRCAEVGLVKEITGVPRGPGDRPNEPVAIKRVVISRDSK